MRRVLLSAISAAALATAMTGSAHAEGNAAEGQQIFRTCAACHSVEAGKNRVGPSLHGVVGRTPGTLDGFRYSSAMRAFGESGHVWDEATLNTYLESPRKVVKGTRMMFAGLKSEQERQNVIAYLRQHSE